MLEFGLLQLREVVVGLDGVEERVQLMVLKGIEKINISNS